MRDKIKEIIKRTTAVAIALAVWQTAALKIHQRILLVTPLAVAKRLLTIWEVRDFWTSIWFTFYHIAAGFIAGLLIGIILAVAASKSGIIETLLWPWMATIRSVPVASFVVICLIWLSAQNLSVFISFLMVVPVIYQNTLTGLRRKDVQMSEMAKIFRLPWYRRIWYITLPCVAPYLISACQVTTGLAWKAGVAAEIIGTPNGSIGQKLYLAKIYLDTDDLLAWTVIIVFISVVSEKVFMFGIKKALRHGGKYEG